VVSRAFLFRLFNWPNWELKNPSHLAFSYTHAAAMVSPKSVELKQGAEDDGPIQRTREGGVNGSR
jgi:hypothetical protein